MLVGYAIRILHRKILIICAKLFNFFIIIKMSKMNQKQAKMTPPSRRVCYRDNRLPGNTSSAVSVAIIYEQRQSDSARDSYKVFTCSNVSEHKTPGRLIELRPTSQDRSRELRRTGPANFARPVLRVHRTT